MVSMKDIAQRCGVSVASVSKALNGQQDIGRETRERILRAADEMGYLTNSAARALKTNRTYHIGVLFVDERRSGLAHEYFSAVLNSLKEEAEARGYDITFINRHAGNKPTLISSTAATAAWTASSSLVWISAIRRSWSWWIPLCRW